MPMIKNVLQYLERSVKRFSRQTACVDGTATYRYGEFARMCRCAGSALTHFIRPGEPVAVYMEQSGLALAALLVKPKDKS